MKKISITLFFVSLIVFVSSCRLLKSTDSKQPYAQIIDSIEIPAVGNLDLKDFLKTKKGRTSNAFYGGILKTDLEEDSIFLAEIRSYTDFRVYVLRKKLSEVEPVLSGKRKISALDLIPIILFWSGEQNTTSWTPDIDFGASWKNQKMHWSMETLSWHIPPSNSNWWEDQEQILFYISEN